MQFICDVLTKIWELDVWSVFIFSSFINILFCLLPVEVKFMYNSIISNIYTTSSFNVCVCVCVCVCVSGVDKDQSSGDKVCYGTRDTERLEDREAGTQTPEHRDNGTQGQRNTRTTEH